MGLNTRKKGVYGYFFVKIAYVFHQNFFVMNDSQYCTRSEQILYFRTLARTCLWKLLIVLVLFRRTSRLDRAPCTRWTRRTCSPATATRWSPTPAARRATASTGCSCSSATCRQAHLKVWWQHATLFGFILVCSSTVQRLVWQWDAYKQLLTISLMVVLWWRWGRECCRNLWLADGSVLRSKSVEELNPSPPMGSNLQTPHQRL